MELLLDQIGQLGIIPVVKIEDPGQAHGLGQALIDGELPITEITFRTKAAQEAISILVQDFPEMLVGAGTILNIQQAETAVEAGARFIVSPGFAPKVVGWCLDRNVLVIPGVATPSDIIMAMDFGLTVLKFFPANVLGGPAAIKAISPVFKDIRFIPTGGLSALNLPEYLALPSVLACGGSWMVKSEFIISGNFTQITFFSHEAVTIVKNSRE